MKILVVTTGLGYGGAERMLLGLSREWMAAGCDLHIISLSDEIALAPQFEECGATVQSLNLGRGPGAFSGLLGLSRAIRRQKPDVVQTWMPHADLLGGLAARLAGVKNLVWGLHHADLGRSGLKLSTMLVVRCNALLSWLVPRAIVAVSEHVRQRHIEAGYARSRIDVVPNAIDADRFQFSQQGRERIRGELWVADEAFVVGFLGRFDRVKRLGDFLDAAKGLANRLENTAFIMAGDGLDAGNARLGEMIRSRGLEQRVSLLGVRDDVPDILSAFDVLLCTSQDEAFGLVVLEALSCQIPCVSTNNQGCVYAGGKFARYVDVGNVAGFVDATIEISQIETGEIKRWAAGARAHAVSDFGIKSSAQRYIELYGGV